MNKNYIVIVFILFLFFLASCKMNNTNDVKEEIYNNKKIEEVKNNNFDIVKSEFSKDNITIKYPQLLNLNNDEKQLTINKYIEDRAKRVLLNYTEEEIKNLNIDINYEIMKKENNFLSIVFKGYIFLNESAHQSDIYETMNINIENEILELNLSDIVTIDDEFIKEIYNSQIFSNENLKSEVKEYLTEQIIKNVLVSESPKYYLKNNVIGINFEVPYAIGSNVQIEISMEEIQNNLKLEYKSKKE